MADDAKKATALTEEQIAGILHQMVDQVRPTIIEGLEAGWAPVMRVTLRGRDGEGVTLVCGVEWAEKEDADGG